MTDGSTHPLVQQVAAIMHPGESALVALRGGADSVALLAALRRLGHRCVAFHCNYGLRGDESERDERHARHVAALLDVPIEVIRCDVAAYKEQHPGTSVEMACRELRYRKFEEIMAKIKADRIAIAHNADDQAETVLLNLMRGAGVSGLRGMLPDTGRIIRPLLSVTRLEIEEYLKVKGVGHITDSSNLSSDYRRNFLRNEVIPMLRTRWPEATASICHTASIMRSEEKVLDWAQHQSGLLEGTSLSYQTIKSSPDEHWAIYRFITRFDSATKIASEIMASLQAEPFQTGKKWRLGNGTLTLERDSIEYTPDQPMPKIEVNCEKFEVDDNLLDRILTSPLDELWTPLPPEKLLFRFFETGDRIQGLGSAGSTKVSKILKDNKLSYARKQTTVVAEVSSTADEESETKAILWVGGFKRSRHHLVGTDTRVAYRYSVEIKN